MIGTDKERRERDKRLKKLALKDWKERIAKKKGRQERLAKIACRKEVRLNNIKKKSNDYRTYLKSDEWKKIRFAAQRDPAYQKCLFCNSTKVDIHHVTYKFLRTATPLRGTIPVCREHHDEIHALAKAEKINVGKATDKIAEKYSF